jgi:choline dehydrogenase-like flavoprotein
MIPGTNSFTATRYTWNITSLPNSELNNQTRTVVSPRIVGGGTALNGMVFDRGSRRDYDEWAEYVGDPGWGWDGLLPYFMKAETFTPPEEQIREKYGIEWDEAVHGTNRPINASYPTFVYPHNSTLILILWQKDAECRRGFHGGGEGARYPDCA